MSFKLAQEFLDDGGDGAADREAGEGFSCSAHHLAHVLDGGGAYLGDDFLDLGFHPGLGELLGKVFLHHGSFGEFVASQFLAALMSSWICCSRFIFCVILFLIYKLT